MAVCSLSLSLCPSPSTHIGQQFQGRLLAISLDTLASARPVPPGGEGVPDEKKRKVEFFFLSFFQRGRALALVSFFLSSLLSLLFPHPLNSLQFGRLDAQGLRVGNGVGDLGGVDGGWREN